ncbi:MAG: UDP-2,3-diacylglucosamine diphosphatase [Saprospiraceae bacterium]|jgi:UDP-2,3-diacylglucosamine pyrophosphatase LpxH|nr:UDP-2,3-diacylglucosamine diphosphatase [Saprospiraceae bacterium]
MDKRELELVVISDIHLGTYGCHAKELLTYLRSIDVKTLILNGDILDVWNLKKSYFPKTHMQVIRQLLKMAEKNCMIFYITGNHDEVLRKYSNTRLGNIMLVDKLILDLGGMTTWFFHGDIFDNTTKGWAKIIAKLGGKGYDLLIVMNRTINHILKYFGNEKVSFSKKIKSGVKQAIKWINNFETTAAELAIEQGFHTVVCGHIHQPQNSTFTNREGSVKYLNSGDWVEHCTALEYNASEWRLVYYDDLNLNPNSQVGLSVESEIFEFNELLILNQITKF